MSCVLVVNRTLPGLDDALWGAHVPAGSGTQLRAIPVVGSCRQPKDAQHAEQQRNDVKLTCSLARAGRHCVLVITAAGGGREVRE